MEGVDISSMFISQEFKDKIFENVRRNENIVNYYAYMFSITGDKKFLNKSDNVALCNKVWNVDKYDDIDIKNVRKMNLCKDRFCANCKKVLQAKRMKKYLPVLEENDDDLYFITFTVPNVAEKDLNDTVDLISEKFKVLINYISSYKKTKIYDFSDWGYKGCLRSLEVSINRTNYRKYHVHLHCAFVFSSLVLSKAYIKNCYSVDNTLRNNYIRLFTNQEVILQKFWKLIYDGVNLKDCIDISTYKVGDKFVRNKGYSVTIDRFKHGQYQEVFKYAIKDKVAIKDKNGKFKYDDISLFEFIALYYSLYNIRQLVAYGIFRKGNENDDLIGDIESEVDVLYDNFVYWLNSKYKFVNVDEKIKDIVEDDKYVYFSRNKIYGYLRRVYLEEKFSDCDDIVDSNRMSLVDYKEICRDEKKASLDADAFMRNLEFNLQLESYYNNILNYIIECEKSKV